MVNNVLILYIAIAYMLLSPLKAKTGASLERIEFRYRQVRCKICNGTGVEKTSSSMGAKCEKCEGTGRRLFPEGPTETCQFCCGRGKDYRYALNGKVCPECDGFGEVKLL